MGKIRLIFALAVGAVWLLTYVVAIVVHDYTGPSLLTPILVMAAGYLLSSGMRGRNGNGR